MWSKLIHHFRQDLLQSLRTGQGRSPRQGLCLGLWLALLLGFAACADPVGPDDPTKKEEVRLAVVLPFSEGGERWTRSLEWVRENILEASGIDAVYELYDEDRADLESLADELSKRPDIRAVIGCYSSNKTQVLASKCAKTYKPVLTISTSVELPRAYGQRGFLWCLSESDVSQCELLLMTAARGGARRVSLLAADDIYGRSFLDWFAFQAVELGLEVDEIVKYSSDNLEHQFAQATKSGSDCLVCAPSTAEAAARMVRCQRSSSFSGSLLFSDVAYSQELVANLGRLADGMEGIATAPDPLSGFEISYEVKFGEALSAGVAQVYDAVMVVCYAHRYAAVHGLELNEAIGKLLGQNAEMAGMWDKSSIRDVFRQIESGATPSFSGASSSLDFSAGNYTSVRYSAYVHWMVYDGKIVQLDHDRGVRGGSSTYAAWEWDKHYIQDFEQSSDLSYPPREGNRAVVVAASRGWVNYRHQADALAVYQMLKRQGYDDDHIVLIMEDDLAYNASNPDKGVVRRTPDGENLHADVEIDHKLSDLSPSDLLGILSGSGEKDLGACSGDNVLFFWSGHGEEDCFLWGNKERLPGIDLARTLRRMSSEGKFRKMLCFVETCYSGSVAKRCEGIPGLLLFTAANENETSKADVFNSQLSVWMTNRFTSVLLEEIADNPETTLRMLYTSLFHRTLGSHVSVYNAPSYGSVYTNRLSEFLDPARP